MILHHSWEFTQVQATKIILQQNRVAKKEISKPTYVLGALGLCEEVGPGGQQLIGDAQETLLGCEAIQVPGCLVIKCHQIPPLLSITMMISREDDGSEHLATRVTFAPVFLFSVEGLSCRFVVIANAFMTSLSSFPFCHFKIGTSCFILYSIASSRVAEPAIYVCINTVTNK